MRAGRVGGSARRGDGLDPPPDRHAGRDRRVSRAGGVWARVRRRYAGARSAAESFRGLAALADGPLPRPAAWAGGGARRDPGRQRLWREAVVPSVRDNPAIAAAWARGQVRQLEDRYAAGLGDHSALEQTIIATSLRFGVLCRFTAYVAVDRAAVVNEGGEVHQITQPVEMPAGWGEDTCWHRPPMLRGARSR